MNFTMASFCTEAASLLQVVGWVITIIKVCIPMLIIFYGIMDFGKAVVASKDDEIKTSAKRLMWRAIAGICIFFIPTLVIWLFGTISDYTASKNGFETCETCLLAPWNCITSG